MKCSLAQPKNSTKTVVFTPAQLKELRELMFNYGFRSPHWLTAETKLTAPRRKLLLGCLNDAGLDGEWCSMADKSANFANVLHSAYHLIEAVQ